ncbi:hypothetical protein F8388_019924 [Cannabis sativa]|uniref:Uncharacterized protein n=1 Tax=Cannabis sativa TaxID=3483 RepID=A0A7J6H750_CANSA|nr:hypothetical protein F8388_019924 [Cannabis sativa]
MASKPSEPEAYVPPVHKMVDLSAFPDREAMWYLEVMEAYKLFYETLIDDFVNHKSLLKIRSDGYSLS